MDVLQINVRAGRPHRTPRRRLTGSRLAVLLLASCLAGPAIASEPPLTLEAAVGLALDNAPQLRAREARRTAASEDLIRSDALPDPSLVVGVQNLPVGGPDAFTTTEDRMTMRRIGISQSLPSRAKRQARRESARAQLELTQAETIATTLDIKRGTAKAWVRWWAAERERELLEALLEQSALAVRAARAHLSGGKGMASDVLAARTTELDLENRLDDAASRIEEARASLLRWIGEAPSGPVAEPPGFAIAPVSEADLLASLDHLANLPTWSARESSAEAALALAKAEKHPDWSIGGGLARRGAGASNIAWLEVSVGLPLFSRNRQDRGVNARSADLEAVRAAREDARRMQAEFVRKAFARWKGLGLQVTRFRDTLLPIARDRGRTALAAYSGGGSLQPWLDARDDEIDERLRYADTLAAWASAWVDLAYLLPGSVNPNALPAAGSPETQQ